MKAISVMQPWASFIAAGLKRLETRSWPTDYTGPLLIHASGTRMTRSEELKLMSREAFQYGLRELRHVFGQSNLRKFQDLPTRGIVGAVNLVRVEKTHEITPADWGPHELALGDFSHGRFAWVLAKPQRIDLIPCKGNLGLWNVPRRVEKAAMAA